MSSYDNSTADVVVVMHEESSFLADKIDLKKLRRELGKVSKQAIEVLVKMLESKDENVKIRAATKLLDLEVDVAKTINQDNIQRLIAELKINRMPKTAAIGNTNESMVPLVDFGTVREIN